MSLCVDLNLIFRYHLKDVIIGKIYFLLVRIKIKNMDLEIRRRESTGSGANTHVETETLAKFELMDGAPVRGMLLSDLVMFFRFILLYDVQPYPPCNRKSYPPDSICMPTLEFSGCN